MSEPDAVLAVAPNWLGDAVMALPAVADLRRHFAGSRLIVAARPSVSSVFTLVPGVDSVKADVASIREANASVAVLFPNSFASAWLVKRSGIPERWGYATDLRNLLLTRRIRRVKQPMHQGAYYQHLVRELGIATGPLEPLIQIPPDTINDARRLLARHGWDDKTSLIVLAPGAAYGKAKQWIPTHVTRLMTDLTRDRGVMCVLVGSRADAPIARAIHQAVPPNLQARVIDVTGETTLPVLAAAMNLSAACVSNDSGAMHLAAAAGVPVAAIFGPTNESATGPLMGADVPSAIIHSSVWCRPCMLRECPLDHRCMTGIEPGRVLAAIDRIARGLG